MVIKIIRVIFVICCVVMGVIWTNYILELGGDQATGAAPFGRWQLFGALFGASGGIAVLFALSFVTQDLFEKLFPVFSTTPGIPRSCSQ